MPRLKKLCCTFRPAVFGLAAACLLLPIGEAAAQSGASPRYQPPQRQPTAGSGSGGRVTSETPVALRGFCPVCLVEMKAWNAGTPQFRATHDGMAYYFPGEEQLAMFQANPAKYLPALGGDDVVMFATTGQRAKGDLSLGVVHEGRMYFFANNANKETFRAQPAAYANADLALGGECVVCRVKMNQSMPGTGEFVAIHKGMRFQFAGEEQRQMFLASPEMFAEAAMQAKPAASGSAPRTAPAAPPAGSGSGLR